MSTTISTSKQCHQDELIKNIMTYKKILCTKRNHARCLLLRLFTLPQSRTHSQGLTIQIPVGQMPVGGATVFGPKHWTDTQGRASLHVWSAQCQGLRRQHGTEHRQRKHTQSQDRNLNSWPRRESNPGRWVGRQGLYRPRHGDGSC